LVSFLCPGGEVGAPARSVTRRRSWVVFGAAGLQEEREGRGTTEREVTKYASRIRRSPICDTPLDLRRTRGDTSLVLPPYISRLPPYNVYVGGQVTRAVNALAVCVDKLLLRRAVRPHPPGFGIARVLQLSEKLTGLDSRLSKVSFCPPACRRSYPMGQRRSYPRRATGRDATAAATSLQLLMISAVTHRRVRMGPVPMPSEAAGNTFGEFFMPRRGSRSPARLAVRWRSCVVFFSFARHTLTFFC
jgi:hypothetical protein